MGYINGISDSTKTALKIYCARNSMTQIQWVESHLNADLLAEGQASNEEGSK